jgi:flagellar biosynthetic protein FliR
MIPDPLARAFAPELWPTFVFVTARVGGLMFIAPLWSMAALPRSARAAVTVLLSLLLLSSCPRAAVSGEVFDLPVGLAMEVVIGLAIGATAAVLVQAATLTGEIVSLQMGLSLGPMVANDPELQVPGVAPLKSVLAMLIYVAAGGHLVLLQGVAASLQALPPGAPIDLVPGAGAVTQLFGTLFSSALRTAAPAMIALLLANATLALLNRAVPQLNAMMVGFPLTIGVGLIALGASLPFAGGTLARAMDGLPGAVEVVIESFAVPPAGVR